MSCPVPYGVECPRWLTFASPPDVQFCTELAKAQVINQWGMASLSTLLCIHRNPAELAPLQLHGYKLMTATNGNEGLRLFMTRPVDAILLEYHLGLLNGGIIAAEIKKVSPTVPILMIIDHLEVPDGALRSVDMVVAKVDGADFLLSAVRYVLGEENATARTTGRSTRGASTGENAATDKATADIIEFPRAAKDDVTFPPEAWQGILDGSVRFGTGYEAFRRKN